MLTGTQLQERLIRRLLGRERELQGLAMFALADAAGYIGGLRRAVSGHQLLDRFQHRVDDGDGVLLRLLIADLLGEGFRFFEQCVLSRDELLDVVRERRCRCSTGLAADQFPRRVDDVLLVLSQLLSLLPGLTVLLLLLLLLLLTAGRLLTLPEDFFEVPDLGEVHVA